MIRIGTLLCLAALGGCASAGPFSAPTPRLEVLAAEEAHLGEGGEEARAALAGNGPATLRGRIDNLEAAYREELNRARAVQGGTANTFLGLTSLVLPVAGTVSSLVISNPDDAATVAAAAGALTTVSVALTTLLKPQERAARGAACQAFLEDALTSILTLWPPEARAGVRDTPQEWRVYLAARAGLVAGRRSACPRN